MADHQPPPTYEEGEREPEIVIIPSADGVNFQKGYLGAEGERAAIEGEVQVKGVERGLLTVALRSVESAYGTEIELGLQVLELPATASSTAFAFPLMPDTPQSLHTAHSRLGHTLTATLHPRQPHRPPLHTALNVHTRRYTPHNLALLPDPIDHTLPDPTPVHIQLPRPVFTAREPIPLYITIPPPSRETVVDRGLRLRNVRAELIRVVNVTADHPPQPSTSKIPAEPSYRAVIARSGASCRFHSSRQIQLRFVLHQDSSTSPSDSRTNLDRVDTDIDSPLITQRTLLHSISFHINVYVSFVDTSSQSERVSSTTLPITILPPHAPLPQVSPAIDDAYQKKHDRPPARTVRGEEEDPSIPHYSEGEAGPSMLSAGAPPPFEERDAPPPFFPSAHEASSSSRLPTFQESEREIILPDSTDFHEDQPLIQDSIPGEGVVFGFLPQDQFDGHTEDMHRSSTPPPTLEMASHDTDLTALTDQPTQAAMEALSLVLEQREDMTRTEERPPPPPPMDDPSDPPPSIDDSEFRSPAAVSNQIPPSRPSSPIPYHQSESAARADGSVPALPVQTPATSHAPPPYLIPDGHPANETDQVARPPPYVD